MSNNHIDITCQSIAVSAAGNIIIPISETADRDRLAKILDRFDGFDSIRHLEAFDAGYGNVWRILHESGEVFLVGLGNKSAPNFLYKILRKFSHEHRKTMAPETGLFLHESLFGSSREASIETLTEFAVNGMIAGTNHLNLLAEQSDRHNLKLLIILHDNADRLVEQSLLQAAETGKIIAEAQISSMSLINMPANWKNPLQFTDTVSDSASKWNYHCEIFTEDRLKDERFEALLAVNRGSEYPARFLVLQYDGTSEVSESAPVVALVGKGVTFDSGGLSIKPSSSMPFMKSDMSGASIVVAVMEAVSRLQLNVRLISAIPLTDNLVDARSVKPGDVIGSYSSKTIEVIDTDAEGRLILADAINWVVRNTSPDYLIDIATLTGSTVRTFGSHTSALFCNDNNLTALLIASGEQAGERVWPMPLWDVYFDDVKSDVADVRNFSGKPVAGAITAAKFLEVFTDKHPSWAHIDIAGTAFGDTEFGKQKNATGYGVRLIVDSLRRLESIGKPTQTET